MNFVQMIRSILAARRLRKDRTHAAVPHFVHMELARHANRLERAITSNQLSEADANAVRSLSSDYLIALIAFQRGRIATVADVTTMVVDHAARLGAKATRRPAPTRLTLVKPSPITSPSFLES